MNKTQDEKKQQKNNKDSNVNSDTKSIRTNSKINSPKKTNQKVNTFRQQSKSMIFTKDQKDSLQKRLMSSRKTMIGGPQNAE